MVVKFKEENLMTFKHLFLKDYVDGEMSRYAVYTQDDLYDHVHYVIEQVTEFEKNLLVFGFFYNLWCFDKKQHGFDFFFLLRFFPFAFSRRKLLLDIYDTQKKSI